MLSLLTAGTAFAAPEGGVVSRGSAIVTQAGNKTDIRQTSDKVILDWRSFDIGADEHAEFHQPSGSSIALNRINDTKASRIDGKLSANGNIMLINPNGVVFGKGSQVDVGSLTVTTADIDDDDFMAGRMDFNKAGASAGKILNEGSITVKDAGLVNFVAPQVENNGVIVAKLGKVQLTAADTFTLDMAGDGMLQVAVSAENGQKIARNSGVITAEGGYVALTASKARGLIDSIVDNSGVIEASSMTSKGGKIILSAEAGRTGTSGTIRANGKTGGGEILIGGDYQGQGTTKNSKHAEIAQSAAIEASAMDMGDGGRVIVWADENTHYAGSIKAQGGVHGGNGGFVETSGKENLHVAEGSTVTAAARHESGEAGMWLLDPSNVTITNGGANNVPGGGGTVNPATDGYTINAASISAALNAGNNVVITTTNGAGTQDGDVMINNATISKTTANNNVSLNVQAARSINVTNSTISSTANALSLTLNADRDANSTGRIKITNSTINLNGGSFIAGGGLDPATTAAVANLNGVFDMGVLMENASIITSGNGSISIRGHGEGTNDGNIGVYLFDSTLIQTENGSITVAGTGGNGEDNNHGIRLGNTSKIKSTTGAIDLTGVGGNGDDNNYGIYISGTGSEVSTGGAIVISASGGSNGLATSTNNTGLLVYSGGAISSTGTGTNAQGITITGNGGIASGAGNAVTVEGGSILTKDGNIAITGTTRTSYGVGVINSGKILADGAGEINLTAVFDTGGQGIYSNTGSNVIGGATATGKITLTADSFNLSGMDVRTSGDTLVKGFNNSTSIGLGGGSGTLNLTDTELGFFNGTGKLIIGDAAAGAGDIDLDSVNASTKLFSAIELYGNDIDIGGFTMDAGSLLAHSKDNGADDGDLNISANITRGVNGMATVDLRADRNITNSNSADIIASDANSDGDANAATSADSLTVILNADRDGDQNGSISLTNGTITTLGGNFIAGGGAGPLGGADGILGNGDGAGADDVAAWGNSVIKDVVFNGTHISTASGNIFIKGHGWDNAGSGNALGIVSYGSSFLTEGGNITMHGTAGDGVSGSYTGINLWTGSLVETNGGNISLTGIDNSTHGNYGRGIILNSAAVRAKNDGSIYLTGMSDLSGTDSDGLRLDSSTVETRGSGDILLRADSIDLWGTSPTSIGGAQATGDIALETDSIDFPNTGNIETSGDMYFLNKTAGKSIGIGGASGDIAISDSELTLFKGTGKFIVGRAGGGTGDISIQSWNLSGKPYDIELYGRDIDINGMTAGAGDITMIAGRNVTVSGDIGHSGAGGNLYIDVGNNFTNSAGADAIDMGTGRFLIYLDALSNVTRGGIMDGNLFGRNYAGDDPSSIDASFGSRFIFDETPTLTLTAEDVTLGAYDPGYSGFTYTVNGLATGDSIASALGGAPSFDSSLQLTPTSYEIALSPGTLTSELGYMIAFQSGLMTIDPGPLPQSPATPMQRPLDIPASVEHQIQVPQTVFSGNTAPTSALPANGNSMMVQRKAGGFRVDTNEADALMRMVTGGYLQIEQPVIDYYGLSSYDASSTESH